MSRIHIWKIEQGVPPRAAPLEGIRSSETERLLEDLLVASPELLEPEMELVARQLPTAGGPLDLLGVDSDGRLVVFELKRGILTREAVAQVLDYASDLTTMSAEALARLVEDHSGRLGIGTITDFREWYEQQHPTRSGPLAQKPRMVLVGLGVDERALRIVNFLAEMGIEIQLLTFHAFRAGAEVLLAKQVESETVIPPPAPGIGTKEANRRILLERAAALGADGFLQEVAPFVEAALGNVYVWPHRTIYSFNVNEETAEGRPTQRYIVSLGPDEQHRGALRLAFPDRVLDLGEDVGQAIQALGGKRAESARYAMMILLEPRSWPERRDGLEALLRLIRTRWQERRRQSEESTAAAGVPALDEPLE